MEAREKMVKGSPLQLRGWGYGGPFCSVLDSLSTKWFWERFSSLQNGMATNVNPTKWCFLSTILDLFSHNDFDIFTQKWSNICIYALRKTPKPFCRVSTLSGTQLQGQFFHTSSHFVDFFRVTRSFSISPKIASQFLHVAKPYIFLPSIC